jgi:ribosomal protein S9
MLNETNEIEKYKKTSEYKNIINKIILEEEQIKINFNKKNKNEFMFNNKLFKLNKEELIKNVKKFIDYKDIKINLKIEGFYFYNFFKRKRVFRKNIY